MLQVSAGGSSNAETVKVVGSPLGEITSSPLALSPAFEPTVTDYVWRCQSTTNTIQLSLAATSGRTIAVGGTSGATVVLTKTLIESQALIISAPDPNQPGGTPAQYWIRCLPHDFPQLMVTKPGTPPPGWYVTENINSVAGSSPYAMVLDANGTPVWYAKSSGPAVVNVTPLPDGSIAWMTTAGAFGTDSKAAFEDFNLQTHATRLLAAPTPPTDPHELHPMPNGDFMMLSTPLKASIDMTALGGSSSATIVDCLLQEVNPTGDVVWQWRASDHIAVSEAGHYPSAQVNRQLAYDLFHCNSIDTDPVSGDVLLSSRQTDAVYLIDKRTGTIIWKLGGKSHNHDNAQILSIRSDPQGAFHAQHDARFQPNGDISLYDDQSWDANLAARAVEYHVDTAAGTATLVWSDVAPDGHNSSATGSFRRLNGGADNVIAWGNKPKTLFTEVDADGHVMLNVTFPSGEVAYRVIKIAPAALDHDLLRATAGLPPFVQTNVPSVVFVGPASGRASGAGTVEIAGAGFTGATAVSFGSSPALSFTVNTDTSITARAPAGSGIVNVVMTGPRGSSSTAPTNQLLDTASDSSFASGTGSLSGENADIGLTSAYARSGEFSLEVSPTEAAPMTTVTGRYRVPAGAQVAGSAWVLTPSGADQASEVLTFYDTNGAPIATDQGPLTVSSTSMWTELSNAEVAPDGAAFVAVGVSDTDPAGSLYVDDEALDGTPRYIYVGGSTATSSNSGLGPLVIGAVLALLLGIAVMRAAYPRLRRR
jgi:arylsulfotransferase ASST/IPT/TIG domain-containing protein